MNSLKKSYSSTQFPIISQLRKNDHFGNFIEVNILSVDKKICSFNCLYCELAENKIKINSIKNYNFNSPLSITNELEKLKNNLILQNIKLDTILISGNGEPTIHPNFSEVSQSLYKWKNSNSLDSNIILLSNGVHFQTKKSISILDHYSEVFIKFDSFDDLSLKKINQPIVRTNSAKLISIAQKINKLSVQSIFVEGKYNNTSKEHLAEYIEVIAMIKPKRIMLGTINSPINNLSPVTDIFLYNLSNKIKSKLDIEIIVNI